MTPVDFTLWRAGPTMAKRVLNSSHLERWRFHLSAKMARNLPLLQMAGKLKDSSIFRVGSSLFFFLLVQVQLLIETILIGISCNWNYILILQLCRWNTSRKLWVSWFLFQQFSMMSYSKLFFCGNLLYKTIHSTCYIRLFLLC